MSSRERAILLVEDNPDDELLTIRALRNNHIVNEVAVARDGAEALEYLFASPTRSLPQIILLDLKLPKVDGLEVLRRVKTDPRTRMVPVIVLTSSDEERDLVDSYSLGANSYIRKPVEFYRFLEALRILGLYWLIVNSPPPVLDTS